MFITRKIEFSASHVCANPALPEEENRRLFGDGFVLCGDAGRVVRLVGVDTWSAIGVRKSVEELEASVLLPQMRENFDAGARAFAAIMCGPSTPADLAARIADDAASMTPQIAISILEDAIAAGPENFEQTLRNLDAPRSCISSESFRPKDAAVLAAFGIDNVVLPGTGHYLMLERPQAFNELLAGVLAR